ncbi:uncharacterized protein HaLaN_01429 [Haematococcus lacustris]|uniref:Uncharacterized protein n=1 Tax=Haematococcus lacustris TaxID=44745 RepID=A0A699YIC6_HAELA|nr:uncharacterized protein HaLaN_01429 [Haematococcus lacustris]
MQLVWQSHEDSLKEAHLPVAALQLERLCRSASLPRNALPVVALAQRIETLAGQRAVSLAGFQVAQVVRGLTGAGHTLQLHSLLALAAVLTAKDCAALHLMSQQQWKDAVWGFAMQGLDNQLFWSKLAAAAVPHISSWTPFRVASVMKNLVMAGVHDEELAEAAWPLLANNVGAVTGVQGRHG